jgi:hypothetical protein
MQLTQEIGNSVRMVGFVSQSYIESEWCQFEIHEMMNWERSIAPWASLIYPVIWKATAPAYWDLTGPVFLPGAQYRVPIDLVSMRKKTWMPHSEDQWEKAVSKSVTFLEDAHNARLK